MISVVAGRRRGKSNTSDNRVLTKCVGIPGFRYCYLTPTYAQLSERYRAVAFHPSLARFIKRTVLQPFPLIEWWNGSVTHYRTFERPENIRGTYYHEVAVDERQDIPEIPFWAVIRPLVSDYRGTIITYGQFRGHDWFYEKLYLPGLIGEESYDPLHESFRFPSSSGIRFQMPGGPEELEFNRRTQPRVIFEQEFECIPTANRDAVFRAEDLKAIKRGELIPQFQAGQRNLMGLDLGRVADPTAVVVFNANTKTVIHAEKFPLGTRHENGAVMAARIARKYNARVIMDSTGGATGGHEKQDAYLQFYRKQIPDVKPFYWQLANKERIVQHLMLEVEQHYISIPAKADPLLLKEMAAYEYEYRGNHYDYHAPLNQTDIHDDYVSALAMAVYGAYVGWGPDARGAPLTAII